MELEQLARKTRKIEETHAEHHKYACHVHCRQFVELEMILPIECRREGQDQSQNASKYRDDIPDLHEYHHRNEYQRSTAPLGIVLECIVRLFKI